MEHRLIYYRNRIKGLLENRSILSETFAVLRFGTYGFFQKSFYPAEVACGSFSINGGLDEIFSNMIYPGPPVTCFRDQVQEAMRMYAYEKPDHEPFNPTDVLQGIVGISKKCRPWVENGKETSVYFTKTSAMASVKGCLQFLSDHEVLDDGDGNKSLGAWEVFPLETLLSEMFSLSRIPANYPEELIEEHLESSFYTYRPELACLYHKEESKERGLVECSTSIIKHWMNSTRTHLKEQN